MLHKRIAEEPVSPIRSPLQCCAAVCTQLHSRFQLAGISHFAGTTTSTHSLIDVLSMQNHKSRDSRRTIATEAGTVNTSNCANGSVIGRARIRHDRELAGRYLT